MTTPKGDNTVTAPKGDNTDCTKGRSRYQNAHISFKISASKNKFTQ